MQSKCYQHQWFSYPGYNEILTGHADNVRLDAFTFYYGLEYMKKNKPRVMYFAFDETDDFAHAGEYAAYLNAAHYTDSFIGELWNYIEVIQPIKIRRL